MTAAAAFAIVGTAAPARAQAWLPPAGEGAVSFVYQNMHDQYHQIPGVGKLDVGPTTSRSMLIDVTYGVTDKLAISFGVPWIAGKYVGTAPHPLVDLSGGSPRFYGSSPLDNGSFHGTLADARLDVRYNVARERFVLTPFVALNAPTHAYTSLAHAAPGQQLRSLQFGVSAAKMFEAGVPRLFVQGRYAYGVTEKVLDISHNRSNMDLEVGYFLTPKLRVMALGTGQLTHGGIDMILNARVRLPAEQFLNHDRISRINYLNAGGGAGYSVSERIDVFGSFIRTLDARNGHLIDRGLSVGMTWSFSVRRTKEHAIVRADQALSRCACTKSAS
jgi:hypothetical protein